MSNIKSKWYVIIPRSATHPLDKNSTSWYCIILCGCINYDLITKKKETYYMRYRLEYSHVHNVWPEFFCGLCIQYN